MAILLLFLSIPNAANVELPAKDRDAAVIALIDLTND